MTKDRIYIMIAGFTVLIQFKKIEKEYIKKTIHGEILSTYKPFIIKAKKIDFTIIFLDALNPEFLFTKGEKKVYTILYEDKKNNLIHTHTQISIFQFQLLLRLVLLHLLSNNKGFMLHASAVVINNKAHLFLAPSGGGKSTVMKLLSSTFIPLCDDSVVIRKEKKHYVVYHTPYIEKEWWIKKTMDKYILGQIYFLKKSKKNYKKPIQSKSVISSLLLKQLLFDKQDIFNKALKESFEMTESFGKFSYLYFTKNEKEVTELLRS